MIKFRVNDFLLTAIGVFLTALGVLAFYEGINTAGVSGVLWFSYTALLLIGIGIATRNSYLIASQLAIIFIPYIFWNIDFYYVLLSGNSLWGITDYFFQPRGFLAQSITSIHIFLIPVSLLAIYFIKIKRKDFWKFSIAQVALFFVLIRLFSTKEQNINCVFSNCLKFNFPFKLYSLAWFVSYLIMILLVTLFLTRVKAFNNHKTYKK